MVNQSVKVFARLKSEEASKIWNYEICQARKSDYEDLLLYGNLTKTGLMSRYKFRFQKIFDQQSQQSIIFEKVAKPVINSVLEGFNGTIFAYGQTGSGKTYTITGSPKNYNDRGIIPRSIQYIFAHNEKVSDKPAICISYMEIYNESGYDLLGTKKKAAFCLEELPRVLILEDKKGECHIRNLSILPVSTEEEAMRLLFLGDTNRTIAETPMNEYSSRSHCIFTIYLTYTNTATDKVKFSKLHLVDLAGSERVHKSLTTGVALSEAKFINLSLHYLQQVILALSEQKTSHVPYRNSMMTNLLKDSLCGNCLTVMIANLSINKRNIPETLSTCKFAQRVSLLNTEPVINEISNSVAEIVYLRSRVKELEEKLASLTKFNEPKKLDDTQIKDCRKLVDSYMNQKGEVFPEHDVSKVFVCVNLLKEEIVSQKKVNDEQQLICDKQKHLIENLKMDIEEKEKQINSLKQFIDNIPEKECIPGSSSMNDQYLYHNGMDDSEKKLFDIFLTYSKKGEELIYYRNNLDRKLEIAKLLSQTLEQCQANILCIRRKLDRCTCHTQKMVLVKELEEQQQVYRKSLEDLKLIKNDTTRLEFGLTQSEIQANKEFSKWLQQPHLNTERESVGEKYRCSYHYDEVSFPTEYSHMERATPFHDFPVLNACYQNYSQICGDIPYYECKSSPELGPCSTPMCERKTFCCSNSNQCILPNRAFKNIDKKIPENSFSCMESTCSKTKGFPKTYPSDFCGNYNTCPKSQSMSRFENTEEGQFPIIAKVNEMNKENSNEFITVSSNTSEEYFTAINSKSIQCEVKQDHCKTAKCGLYTKESKMKRMLFESQLDTIPEIDQIETSSNTDESFIGTAKVKIEAVSACTSIKQRQSRRKLDSNKKENSANVIGNENEIDSSGNVATKENNTQSECGKGDHFNKKICADLFESGDSDVFKEFVNTLQLTGDVNIDQEIVNFYRTKFV